MSNVLKWLLVVVLFAALAAVGGILGSLLGHWGVIPAVIIGGLIGRYVIPRILWAGGAEDA